MDYNAASSTISSTLRLEVTRPAYAVSTFAIMGKDGVMRAYVNASNQLVIPGGLGSTSLLVNSASKTLGFATGAGGAVTQITSSSTGVTLDTPTGQITTVALTTAAGAEEVFTVTNATVAATDIPVVSTTYAGAGTVQVTTKKVATGAFDIVIANLHASNALNAAVVVNFGVIKGVAA